MASIRNRIVKLSDAIENMTTGKNFYPDPERIQWVEDYLTGKIESTPLTTEQVAEIERELEEIGRNYAMPRLRR